MEGGALLLVKWADRAETCPCAFQWKIATDDLHDVAGFSNFLDALVGDSWHLPEKLILPQENPKSKGGNKGVHMSFRWPSPPNLSTDDQFDGGSGGHDHDQHLKRLLRNSPDQKSPDNHPRDDGG